MGVHLMQFLYYMASLASGPLSVSIPVGFVCKKSSLKGTIPTKANGFKSKKPFSLIAGPKFNCTVSVQYFQCLPCLSLCFEHHESLESMTPCF